MISNQRVIDRVNEILRQVSDHNPSGRAKRYIGSGCGGAKSRLPPKKGKRVTVNDYSSDLYNQMGAGLNEGSYIVYDEDTGNNYFDVVDGGNRVGGNMLLGGKNVVGGKGIVGFPTGGARHNALQSKPKKIQVDNDFEVYEPYVKKTKRKRRADIGKSRQTTWTQFVKEVSLAYGIPYNKALTVASQLRKQGATLDDN